MAKRKNNNNRKTRVYYNSDTDTWSNDTHEQPYLMPGTQSYEAYQEQQLKDDPNQPDDEFHKNLEEDNEDYREEQVQEDKEFEKKSEVTRRKYRRYMSKEVQRKAAEKIIEDGLERDIPTRDFSDELYDDGVSGDKFVHEAAVDYKHEFDEKTREVPEVDNNGDGKVDEDDAYMTPGMKKMARYM